MDEGNGWDSREGAKPNRGPVNPDGNQVIRKVSYTHDAMIDMLVENPQLDQRQLARCFGYTEAWVSQIINSDAFRERLAARKDAIVDPVLRMSVEERIRGLVDKSVQILLQKMNEAPTVATAVKVLDVGTRALGYGARQGTQVTQTNYIALVPPTSPNAGEWAAAYHPLAAPAAIAAGGAAVGSIEGLSPDKAAELLTGSDG